MNSIVSAEKFLALMKSDQPVKVIDVRTSVEISAQRLPGAMHLPLDQLEDPVLNSESISESIAELQALKGELYLLCKSGKRADRAKQVLSRHLSAALVTIEGGLDALVEAGCEVEL